MDWVRIANGQVKSTPDEVLKLARESVLPMFRKISGFLGYEIVLSPDGKTFLSVSRWRSRDAAEEGARLVTEFVRKSASHAVAMTGETIGTVAWSSAIAEQGRVSAPSYPS